MARATNVSWLGSAKYGAAALRVVKRVLLGFLRGVFLRGRRAVLGFTMQPAAHVLGVLRT
eukprot:scaffold31461_cov50-Phaeocystis_antarctica.AAC.6